MTRTVLRFTLTERLLHWVHAAAFFVLLGSGLVLYIPVLSREISRRPLMKDIHIWTAVAWAAAIALIVIVGNRRALARTIREIDLFDRAEAFGQREARFVQLRDEQTVDDERRHVLGGDDRLA